VSKHEDMMMNFQGTFPHPGTFNFGNFNFDHSQLQGMMNNLKPHLDKLRKEIRIRIQGDKMTAEDDDDCCGECEESGLEL
jgi:hypothetical protein